MCTLSIAYFVGVNNALTEKSKITAQKKKKKKKCRRKTSYFSSVSKPNYSVCLGKD